MTHVPIAATHLVDCSTSPHTHLVEPLGTLRRPSSSLTSGESPNACPGECGRKFGSAEFPKAQREEDPSDKAAVHATPGPEAPLTPIKIPPLATSCRTCKFLSGKLLS